MNSTKDVSLHSSTYAAEQDSQDPLQHLRAAFVIPTRSDLTSDTAGPPASPSPDEHDHKEITYFCGNSLGLQPRLARRYLEQYLSTWATKGVHGHFKRLRDTALPPWLDCDSSLQDDMARLVGAQADEIAMMQTLTGNLHLMMCSFYRPTAQRWKIIMEGKAFPSDHYAVESQIRIHDLPVESSMILIEPPSGSSPLLPIEHILSIIDQHASETALLLLPGIQFYTGQLLDIPRITAHAQRQGILVGWELAHAAGNVPLRLHEWNVDFAVWCTYKYLNCGPGCMGGCFVHERHNERPRLTGWWGSKKQSRFAMTNQFEPMDGAAGWQLSNPSVADSTAVRASLDVFNKTSMDALRDKSLALTGYLESMLDRLAEEQDKLLPGGHCFSIITPRDPHGRGAQLSVRLRPGLLDSILETLERGSVVLDERKPDVIRVAPAPLYNSYMDVFNFVRVFAEACMNAIKRSASGVE